MFVDVYLVLCLFYLTSCVLVCVCHLSHGPFAGVPSSQALPGFLITAPPPVLVPDVLGAPAVWIQNPKKKRYIQTCDIICGSAFEPGASGLPCACTPPVCVPAVLGALAVRRHNNNQTKKALRGRRSKDFRVVY